MRTLLARSVVVFMVLGLAVGSAAQSVPRADDMKRLVLFQTPAHAAGEISRVMAAVQNNRMPLDEIGIEKELDAATKAVLLKYGAVFESTVKAAYAWERGN